MKPACVHERFWRNTIQPIVAMTTIPTPDQTA